MKSPTQKGASITALIDTRSIQHLDPTSPVHEQDRKRAREYRESLNRLQLLLVDIPEEHRYRSVAGGFRLDANGNEETSVAYNLRMEKLKKRTHYKAPERKKDGSTYMRPRRASDPIRQMPVTFRPDHALAFGRLDHQGMNIKYDLVRLIRHVGQSFQKETGYELQGMLLHPREGALHLHITYATVTESGRLLHGGGKAGNPNPRVLHHGFIGSLRLGDAGWISDGRVTRANQKRIERRRNGKDAPDWAMSELLDALIEYWVAEKATPEVRHVFRQAFIDYGEATKRAEAQDPERQLREREWEFKRLKMQFEVMEKSVVDLDEKLVQAKATAERALQRVAELEKAAPELQADLRAELTLVRADREHLQKELESLQSESARSAQALGKRTLDLHGQLAAAKSLANQHSQRAEKLEKKIADIFAEHAKLRTQLVETMAAGQQREQRLAQLETENTQLQQAVARQETQLKHATQVERALRDKVKQLEPEKSQALPSPQSAAGTSVAGNVVRPQKSSSSGEAASPESGGYKKTVRPPQTSADPSQRRPRGRDSSRSDVQQSGSDITQPPG